MGMHWVHTAEQIERRGQRSYERFPWQTSRSDLRNGRAGALAFGSLLVMLVFVANWPAGKSPSDASELTPRIGDAQKDLRSELPLAVRSKTMRLREQEYRIPRGHIAERNDRVIQAAISPPAGPKITSAARREVQLGAFSKEQIARAFVAQLGVTTQSGERPYIYVRTADLNGRRIYRVRVRTTGKKSAVRTCAQFRQAGQDCFVVP
jgi:hypothetical protein